MTMLGVKDKCVKNSNFLVVFLAEARAYNSVSAIF